MKAGAYMHVVAMVLAGLLGWTLPATSGQAAGGGDQKVKPADSGVDRTLSMAESQHEIVMILIQKKDFAQAAAEADKIFQMSWPAAVEDRFLKELRLLTDQFLKHQQPAIGLQLLERHAKAFKSTRSQVEILKEMGYMLKGMGENDRALECFRKAQQLEKSSPD
jgi:tetratricopeptide (TPR) repeat protein